MVHEVPEHFVALVFLKPVIFIKNLLVLQVLQFQIIILQLGKDILGYSLFFILLHPVCKLLIHVDGEIPKLQKIIEYLLLRLTAVCIYHKSGDILPALRLFHSICLVIRSLYPLQPLNPLLLPFLLVKILTLLLVAQFVYQFAQKLTSSFTTMTNALAGELVVNHIKLKIMNKAKTVDVADFDRPDFYEKLENANREAGMRPIQILNATFNIVSSLISVVSFIVILASLHPLAPIVMIAAAIPGTVVSYRYRHKNFRYMRLHSKERRQMNYFSSLVSDKDKVKEVRIMGLADTLIGKYRIAFKKYFAGLKKLIIKEHLLHTLINVLTIFAHLFVFMYVAYTVIYRDGLIGDYQLYTGALGSIMSYVRTIITATATIYEGTLFIDNMITFMKNDVTLVPSVEPPILPKKNSRHEIEFKNVSFCYPGTERRVINNVSFKIKSGEQIVLVGLNGAGKTTLIKLLTRLYDPTEGVILLDGRDIREYDIAALYDIFGIIFQDFVKYAVDVSENISFGDVKEGATEQRVKDAACRADADSFIVKLPDGYSTPLMRIFEENGIELSIGQWQKLSIARAFYKDSDVLILDEPTASLDPLAEQEVFNRFAELGEDKITLFVSHRLSSATTATKIIVLEDGAIVEMGNHHELMEKEGKYHLLFTTQAKRYIDASADGADEIYTQSANEYN